MHAVLQKPHRSVWPILIVGLLAAHATMMMVAVRYATGGSQGDRAVVANFYEKGVAWDAARARQSASDKLGWQATIIASASDTAGRRTLSIVLTDRAGEPVDATDMAVSYFHLSHGDNIQTAIMASASQGRYEATAAISRPGFYQFDVNCKRGSDAFVLSTTQFVH